MVGAHWIVAPRTIRATIIIDDCSAMNRDLLTSRSLEDLASKVELACCSLAFR